MSKKAQTRSNQITPASFDEKAGTIKVVYSTGARVDRGVYLEDLVVSEDAIDATRLDAGAVHLIRDHMPYGDPVGRVISHGVEDGEAFAVIQLSSGSANASTVNDIKTGVVRFVSVGYVPLETKVDESGDMTVVTVTRWMPLEISLTPIPADIGAQTRSLPTITNVAQKGKPMKTKAKTRATPEELESQIEDLEVEQEEAEAEGDTAAVEEIDAEIDAVEAELEEAEAETEGEDEADDEVATERARSANIFAMATRNHLPAAVAIRAIERGTSEKAFRAMIKQRKISNSPAPLAGARTSIQVDEVEKRTAAATNAMYGLISGKRSTDAGDFAAMGPIEIAQHFLGRSAQMKSRREIARMAIRSGMHTTSDFGFTTALGGAIDRRVREAHQNLDTPLLPMVQKTLVNDTRPYETYSAGGFPALKPVPEGGEYEGGTLITETSMGKVGKFGRRIDFSIESFINDDLRLIDGSISGIGRAYVTLQNKLFSAAWGDKLADGKAVFHASRGNLLNVPLDVAGLGMARAALRRVKGIDGDDLFLSPKILIVSPELETDAQRLISPITAAVTGEVNPFAGTLQLIVDPLMQGNEWILAADPAMGDAIEMAELRGEEGVFIEQMNKPEIDCLSWKARVFTSVKMTGWRGLIKSTGGN